MRNPGMNKLQYLMYALLIFALTGCGASNLANLAGNSQPGAVQAQMVYGASKNAAKTVNAAPAGVTSIQVAITGSDLNGKAIPVVRGTIDPVSGLGTIAGIYPGKVTMAVKAMSGSVVSYEGFAIGVAVNAGATTNAGTIVLSPPTEKAQDSACIQCHETTLDSTGQNLVAEFKQSTHYDNQAWTGNVKFGITGTGCAGCHGPSHNDVNPATGRCAECHVPTVTDSHHSGTYLVSAGPNTICSTCHNSHNPFGPFVGGACVACHAFPQDATRRGNYVNDNNGVRAITTEFNKWSHHVTGVALNSAHCAACHLEGTVVNGQVTIDTTKHMADAKIHLRNADTDADFAWDPSAAAPDFTGMDNFCMSCHDSNGATSPMSAQIQGFINSNGLAAPGKTASASNPFGDTISNRYDKMQRPAVVDASSQFNTTNNSHHGVKGPRYTGRTRVAGPRQIKSPTTFAQNSSATLMGARSTIYDAGNFNALYSPLGTDGTNATGLGDDSTLHCQDCHTVGQWKVGSTDTANGSPNPVAIGAHGANNEYLLRNTLGTDQRHTQNAYVVSATNVVTYTNPNGAFLVCYNCHSYNRYGSIFVGTGLDVGGGAQPHAGEYDASNRCNGVGDTIPFNGYTTGKATDGTQFLTRFAGTAGAIATTPTGAPTTLQFSSPAAYPGEQPTSPGNVFGIQCLSCHNSGIGNAFGGIHGSANNTNTKTQTVNASVTGGAYINGMGNTTKVERFLPGLGDAMHVPGTLGGVTGGTVVGPITNTNVYTYTTGGITNDTNWEQKGWQQTATTTYNLATGVVGGTTANAGAGCYTLGTDPTTATNVTAGLSGPSVTGTGGAATALYGTWGGCDDHSAPQGAGNHGFVKRIVRPVTY